MTPLVQQADAKSRVLILDVFLSQPLQSTFVELLMEVAVVAVSVLICGNPCRYLQYFLVQCIGRRLGLGEATGRFCCGVKG